jgi:hypothetical protein
MTTYLLVMLLSSGEIVRSEVPLSYCTHFKGDIQKALAKVGTQ